MASKLEDMNIARGTDSRAASGVDWAHETLGAGSRVATLPFKVREPLNESSTAFANIIRPSRYIHRYSPSPSWSLRIAAAVLVAFLQAAAENRLVGAVVTPGEGNLLPRLSPRCTWTLPRRVGLSCRLFLRYTAKFMDLFESNWMTVNVEVAGDSSAIPISVLSSTTRQRSWPYARHRCCRRIWWPACSDTQPL